MLARSVDIHFFTTHMLIPGFQVAKDIWQGWLKGCFSTIYLTQLLLGDLTPITWQYFKFSSDT